MSKTDPQFRKKSIVLLDAKALFLDWVTEASGTDPLNRSPDQIYNNDDPTAWLIPRVDTFDDGDELNAFLSEKKPGLLRAEVGAVYKGIELFPYEFDEATFDKCFVMRIATSLVDISELEQPHI